MISYAIFLFHAMGMSVTFFVRDKLQLYSFEVYLIWIVYYTSRLFFVFFLLVLTRVAHPKLCFAQKPLLYPKRAQTIEENKQTHISKKKGVQNQSLRILLLHVYLVSSWLHFAYLTSGFLLQNTLTLNWKRKVKQVQKKDGGYKVQQYKILPSFSCKSQVKSRLL